MATPEQPVDNRRYCPRCLSPLISGEGTRVYETLVEHVFSTNGSLYAKGYYICSRATCPTRIDDDFWDDYGDFYSSRILTQELFLLCCDKAIGSGSREFALSCQRKKIVLIHLIWFKAYLELSPVSDKMGLKIVGYKPKIQACTRTSVRNNWTSYIPGIHMFFFCIKSFNQAYGKYLENPGNKYSISEVIRELKPEPWDKRWWKMLSRWLLNKLHPKLLEQLQCKEKI